MQNMTLKNELAPWQEKGRWYHGVYNCGNGAFISDETDPLILTFTVATTSSVRYIYTDDPDIVIAEVIVIPKGTVTIGTNAAASPGAIRLTTDGNIGRAFCPTGATGELDVYLFVI